MEPIKVVVTNQGNKYDVEVDPQSTGEDFKLQLFSLTGVEPERQKVIIKGFLKDDAVMGELGLRNGQNIRMVGTSAEDGFIGRLSERVKFVEDMSDAEAARQEGATPAGLQNLGNTCYLNSTLQALRSIPELQDALVKYSSTQPTSSARLIPLTDLTSQLKDLYKTMSETQAGVAPYIFLEALRAAFPQFAERSKSGPGYAQQDAEEAWSQIVSQLRQGLKVEGSQENQPGSFIDRYLAGEFRTKLECDDPAAREGGEQPTQSKEPFLKLNCHIDSSTNHLRDGIMKALSEKIEKKSSVLDRDVIYTKKSEISRLPKYLTVHFVRFFWRKDVSKKAKIMRKVTFPQELDVVEFCTEDLRKALVPVRDKVREIRKEEEDVERAQKRRKTNPAGDDGIGGSSGSSTHKNNNKKKDEKKDEKQAAAPTNEDAEMTDAFKTDADWEAEKHASLLAAKKELHALIDSELAKDDGANQSGLYELRGVVTHQGASADSGHYTAYVKKTAATDPKTGKKGVEDGNWWWFNDDKVSEVTADKIDTLSGGGESHSALILLYKAIPLPTAEGIME